MAKTERFVASTRIEVPAEELFAWHERPGAFERLVPPFNPVEVVERSQGIDVGARTVIRMKVGPVPQTLVAEHTAYEKGRMFRDEQRSGPFASWVHTHRFIPEGTGASTLRDEIEYALPLGALGEAFGGGKAERELSSMFAYRHRVTKTDLERHAQFKGALRIAITGASGLIGQSLSAYLTTAGHTVLPVVRRSARHGEIAWNPAQGEIEREKLEGLDAVIHLAGANVAEGRWTDARKAEILNSREMGTRTLATALGSLSKKPRVFISSSAIGYYGLRGDEVLDESATAGDDFLAGVCKVWEAQTVPAEDAGIRTVRLRTGVVLSPAGGALQKMLTPFKLGAGGRIGSGKQWMSWISIEDLLGLMELALHSDALAGAVNAVAPNPVTNAEFAKVLGRVLHRPSIAPVPAFAIKAAFGEMGETTVLASQRVLPKRAEAAGFRFLYPELEPALRMLLGIDRIGFG